jgi:peptide deformylase
MTGVARPITIVGDPVLRVPCVQVERFDDELAQLIDDMVASMHAAHGVGGVGLAANQIGVGLRVFVYDCPDDEGVRHQGYVVNPVLAEVEPSRRRLVEADEGCLSVPGPYAPLARPDYALVRGVDKHGAPITVEGTGFFARCLQHEADHLDGVLYIDRLGKRARKTVLAEMRALAASAESAAAAAEG